MAARSGRQEEVTIITTRSTITAPSTQAMDIMGVMAQRVEDMAAGTEASSGTLRLPCLR